MQVFVALLSNQEAYDVVPDCDDKDRIEEQNDRDETLQ